MPPLPHGAAAPAGGVVGASGFLRLVTVEAVPQAHWADFMELESILRIVLFCSVTGFAFFCASYALHVWRTRNAAGAGSVAKRGMARLMRRWFGLCALLGVVILAGVAIWREAVPREGVLVGDGIFTVRAESDLQLEYVIDAGSVEAGEIVARFRCPQRQAELAEWRLKKQILQTQKDVLRRQPLAPDPELVRVTQNLYEDQRQLEASVRYLIPEQAAVEREKVRDRLDRLERLNALNTQLAETRKKSLQVAAELDNARRHEIRADDLASQSAASTIEVDDRATATKVLEAELAMLAARTGHLETEIEHIEAGLQQFAECASDQSQRLADEIATARQKLADTRSAHAEQSRRLMEDLERARSLQAGRLSQLDLEIEQCNAQLRGLEDVLEIKAPFTGRVAYTDPAPRAALPLVPVLVLTPAEGFRFRLRLPDREITPLKAAGSVPLRLVDGILHRRFTGRLAEWEPLPDESGYVLAEVVCQPPPETIRELASGGWRGQAAGRDHHVEARLLWRAPLTNHPLFWSGIGLLGLGLIGSIVARLRPRRGAEDAPDGDFSPIQPEIDAAQAPEVRAMLDNGLAASGAVGRNLEQLGRRFREAIRRRDVPSDLIRAIEWAMDRHHTRAIEHLGIGLDHDEELSGEVQAFLGNGSRDPAEAAFDGTLQADHVRVERILRAIRPELLSLHTPPLYDASPVVADHAVRSASGHAHRFTEASRRAGKRAEERFSP